jgi:hypothetical protein
MSTNERLTNAPESESLSLGDVTLFEAARNAMILLKKTFETWVVIGKAVVRAREISDRRGGGKTFMRIIEQQGLERIVSKSTASTLERIMSNLPAVTAWHETLTDRQQVDWAAPTTILKRCPVFNAPKPDDGKPKPPTKAEQDRMALAAALEENHRLKKADGSLFDLRLDSGENIGITIADAVSESKFNAIVKAARERYKVKKQKPAG